MKDRSRRQLLQSGAAGAAGLVAVAAGTIRPAGADQRPPEIDERAFRLLQRFAGELRARIAAAEGSGVPGRLAQTVIQYYREVFLPEYFVILRMEVAAIPPDKSGSSTLPPLVGPVITQVNSAMLRLQRALGAVRDPALLVRLDNAVRVLDFLLLCQFILIALPGVRRAMDLQQDTKKKTLRELLLLILDLLDLLLELFGGLLPAAAVKGIRAALKILRKLIELLPE